MELGKIASDSLAYLVNCHQTIDLKSAAIILVHSHPSGDPSPSRLDVDLTRVGVEAGKMGIAVHDHIIVGTKAFVSLRGQGLI